MYIDIHTHKNCREGSFCIKNIVLDYVDKINITQVGYFSCGLHPWFIGNSKEIDKQLTMIDEIIHHKNLQGIDEAGLAMIPILDEPNKKTTGGTFSYMPAVFGCVMASVVIRDLLGMEIGLALKPCRKGIDLHK